MDFRTGLAALGLLSAFTPMLPALAGGDVSLGWRPTARNAYVFYGSSAEQFDLPDLIAGKDVTGGVRNSNTELARFELEGNIDVADGAQIGARTSGGRFRLKVNADEPTAKGQDYTWDAHTRWNRGLGSALGSDVGITTVVGARVRKWWFDGGKIPSHGNVGLLIGVQPKWGPASLLVEATLAAVWLGDLNAWGAQKDSSILRIRPEVGYALSGSPMTLWTGLEYSHTHSEFFGSKLVEGEDAIMLDDFELSALAGARYRF